MSSIRFWNNYKTRISLKSNKINISFNPKISGPYIMHSWGLTHHTWFLAALDKKLKVFLKQMLLLLKSRFMLHGKSQNMGIALSGMRYLQSITCLRAWPHWKLFESFLGSGHIESVHLCFPKKTVFSVAFNVGNLKRNLDARCF